jgi:hypothetical protein
LVHARLDICLCPGDIPDVNFVKETVEEKPAVVAATPTAGMFMMLKRCMRGVRII